MIRDLRPSDLTRQLLPGRLAGQDLACPREKLLTLPHRFSLLDLARYSLGATRHRRALTLIEGMHLLAMAVLRPRQGIRAWELAHLYASPRGMDRCGALLEQCSGAAASEGAERLFLRVHEESPVEEVARRSGFYPSLTERAYQLQHGAGETNGWGALRLRPRTPADAHALFRLYNACVPSTVRSAYGLTLDQWRDAQEPAPGAVEEYAWERDGTLRGWLRLSRKGPAVAIDAMLHPDEGAAASLFCREALRLAGGSHRPAWVVPDHQTALTHALVEAGWEHQRSYSVLIKTVMKRVGEISMAPVRV